MGCGASSSKSPSSDPIEGKPVAAITAQPAAANSSAGGKPAAAAADDDDDMWSVPPPPPLSAERRERVKQLYNVFFAAMGKEGGIPVKDLQALSTSQIGPHKAFPLAGDVIEAIDDNSDGFLSEEELVSYFTKSSSALNDGEFNVVLDDIIEHAPTNIAAAVEEQRELDAMFAPPPAPELSEARAASIKDLFAAFAASCGSTDAGVEVRKMQECAKTKLGNATALPLAGDEFQAMDTGKRTPARPLRLRAPSPVRARSLAAASPLTAARLPDARAGSRDARRRRRERERGGAADLVQDGQRGALRRRVLRHYGGDDHLRQDERARRRVIAMRRAAASSCRQQLSPTCSQAGASRCAAASVGRVVCIRAMRARPRSARRLSVPSLRRRSRCTHEDGTAGRGFRNETRVQHVRPRTTVQHAAALRLVL